MLFWEKNEEIRKKRLTEIKKRCNMVLRLNEKK
jgi:hypothetical protein